MRSLAPLGAVAALAGCAYFNGIYNARVAERHGDDAWRAGRAVAAESLYLAAARSAESVLVHHPGTRWHGDAQLIAGWSWTMARRCGRAEPHLVAVLTRSDAVAEQLARATLALGICRIREGRPAQGRALLAPLAADPRRDVAHEAALWTAVASIALHGHDSAAADPRGLHAAGAEWELIALLLEREALAPAESLLARRAARGDFRPEVLAALDALWRGGRRAGVARIVALYDVSRARADDRARVQYGVGMLALRAGDDRTAARALATAQRLARDPVLGHEAAVALAVASLRRAATVAEATAVLARARLHDDDPALRRLDDALLLLRMLREADEGNGAGLFLAAEVARDSLSDDALARALYGEVVALPRSALAEKALLAAARLPAGGGVPAAAETAPVASAAFGDVAETAGGTAAVSGADPVALLLDRTWRSVAGRYADSLRRRRPAGANAARSAPAGLFRAAAGSPDPTRP